METMEILELEIVTEVAGVMDIDTIYREICEEDQY